ncbi:hypothetical protein BDN72DRAFT_964250 [Pluteus cervinus]|uniref:Uncharacterized protein n=1 Tax=Pluteus cervinus TaxID=181527 RepID=A0ACD3AAK5_9AGAR|nr:hypothetical protein BDN72DRAFT_964250 [Pluteus cervinus]
MAPNTPYDTKGNPKRNIRFDVPPSDTGATPRLAPSPSVLPPRFRKRFHPCTSALPPRFCKGILATQEDKTPGENSERDDGGDDDLTEPSPTVSPVPSKTGEKEPRDEKSKKSTSPVPRQEENMATHPPQEDVPLAPVSAATTAATQPNVLKTRGKKRSREVESEALTTTAAGPETRKLRPRSAFKYSR